MIRKIEPKRSGTAVQGAMHGAMSNDGQSVNQAAQTQTSSIVNPRPRKRPAVVLVEQEKSEAQAASLRVETSMPLHRVKAKSEPKYRIEIVNGKQRRRATGGHDEGYCMPPIKNQFQKGNRGGGRPRGSKSQATLEREALNKKYSAMQGGRKRMVAARGLIAEKMVTTVLKKDNYRDLRDLSDRAARLHPDQSQAQLHAVYDPAADLAVIEQVKMVLALGDAGRSDPLADIATASPDLGQSTDGDSWSEGDWDSSEGEDGHDDA